MKCHWCRQPVPVVTLTSSCFDCEETGVTLCDACARTCWLFCCGNRGFCAVDGNG